MYKIFIISVSLFIQTTAWASSYIFFKGTVEDPKQLTDDEYAAVSAIMEVTEFSHLLSKKPNEVDRENGGNSSSLMDKYTKRKALYTPQIAATLEQQLHPTGPFFEESLIQERINAAEKLSSAGVKVTFIPAAIAQSIIVDHVESNGPSKSYTAVFLNNLVLSKLGENFKELVAASHDNSIDFKRGFLKDILMSFNFNTPKSTISKETLVDIILNMATLERTAAFKNQFLLLRSIKTVNSNGLDILDIPVNDGGFNDLKKSFALSYNYSLFAGYEGDFGACTLKLALNAANFSVQPNSLYAVYLDKNEEAEKYYSRYIYLPPHNPLDVIFDKGETFHPRTYGRTNSGMVSGILGIEKATDLTHHDILIDELKLSQRAYDWFSRNPNPVNYDKAKSARKEKYSRESKQKIADDGQIFNDDYFTLQLMKYLADRSVILVLGENAINSNFDLPVRYDTSTVHGAKAAELTANQKRVYDLELRHHQQRHYVRHVLPEGGRPAIRDVRDAETPFAASPHDYVTGTIDTLRTQLSIINQSIVALQSQLLDDGTTPEKAAKLQNDIAKLSREKDEFNAIIAGKQHELTTLSPREGLLSELDNLKRQQILIDKNIPDLERDYRALNFRNYGSYDEELRIMRAEIDEQTTLFPTKKAHIAEQIAKTEAALAALDAHA